MLYNLVNISLGDDPDIVSFVLSDLLTFLQVFKTKSTLPVEGHILNSLYLWQICFQKRIFKLPLSNEILTYINQYNASHAYNTFIKFVSMSDLNLY